MASTHMEAIMESLIEAVHSQPCLWNPLHSEYRDTSIKESAWQTVVEAINHKSISDVKIAKTEWKRLRDNHRDALKRAKLGKNKLLPAQITTWKYAKAMQFLEPYMKYRITENIEMDSCSSKINSNFEHDVSTSEVLQKNLCTNVVKRPRVDTVVSNNKYSQQVDALDAFFNCVRQSTREMPQWLQTHVKKKIFAVIIEAEELLAAQGQGQTVPPHNNNMFQFNSCNDSSHGDMEISVKTELTTDDDDESIY